MKLVELSGGVGGARLARGFDQLPEAELTLVVNVGDDSTTHGLNISPDLDTVVYTLAGVQGEHGWGRRGDTFAANDELGFLGMDNTFKLGDRDLALKIFRTDRIAEGASLSEVTREVAGLFGIRSVVLPATDDRLRTEIGIDGGEWLSFQNYFVHRGHRDEVRALRFSGADEAVPAPGVLEAISDADMVVIAPSNPPLSIWPILAIPAVQSAVAEAKRTVAVSPLIAGKALKGPADRVLAALGLPPGNAGVAEAYKGTIDTLVIHEGDDGADTPGVEYVTTDTLIPDTESAVRLAGELLDL